jgi:hypothetical protein
MRSRITILLLVLAVIAGCTASARIGKRPAAENVVAERGVNRCTVCHAAWNRQFGSPGSRDRYGFSDDGPPGAAIGFTDPWGLDAGKGTRRNSTAANAPPGAVGYADPNPAMHLGGYLPLSGEHSRPEDFTGRVIVVDAAGNGDVRTIGEGVDRAERGSTVFVRAGRYDECVRLREGIRLRGENPRTTVIEGGEDHSGIVAANGCDISGFTVTGAGTDMQRGEFHAGILVSGCDSTLIIRGNIITGNEVFGILVEGPEAAGTPAWQVSRGGALARLPGGYDGPRIVGNAFTAAGGYAVFCSGASPEIANNVFAGNMKAAGMTRGSRPFLHHNVFYRNRVALNVERSAPVVCFNIMLRNSWGQKMNEGSSPFVHDNVVWESPWFRDFSEDGLPVSWTPFPGTGEVNMRPSLADPDSGDFRLVPTAPVRRLPESRPGYGLVKGYGIPYPPLAAFDDSAAERYIAANDTTRAIAAEIDREKKSIRTIEVSYTITCRSFLTPGADSPGGGCGTVIAKTPVSGTDYSALFVLENGARRKDYRMTRFAGAERRTDEGTVTFDGDRVRSAGGAFGTDSRLAGDIPRIGEHPVRENPGGIFLDYDQYLNGAAGPDGTFFTGFLRLFGGAVSPGREVVDGVPCVTVRYPALGSDRYFVFLLDPDIGYRPRRIDRYIGGVLARRIDGYSYARAADVFVPVSAVVTDYAVSGECAGKIVGTCVMKVVPGTLKVNGVPAAGSAE